MIGLHPGGKASTEPGEQAPFAPGQQIALDSLDGFDVLRQGNFLEWLDAAAHGVNKLSLQTPRCRMTPAVRALPQDRARPSHAAPRRASGAPPTRPAEA